MVRAPMRTPHRDFPPHPRIVGVHGLATGPGSWFGARGRGGRLTLALFSCAAVVGCASVTERGVYAPHLRQPTDQPLSVEENQNAPPPSATGGRALSAVVLWCSQPEGSACIAAQRELGLVPRQTELIPGWLVGPARDTDDDCLDPDLAPLMQRLSSALRLSASEWIDQGGQLLGPAALGDLFAGSGCTNAGSRWEPPLKIHVVDYQEAPQFLVRVWEAGEVAF